MNCLASVLAQNLGRTVVILLVKIYSFQDREILQGNKLGPQLLIYYEGSNLDAK
jgi:hypothetical protein